MITMDTKNQVVMEGTNVKIQCNVEGHPTPTIIWKLNDSMICEQGVMKAMNNGSLFISSVATEHSGIYTCTAVNSHGSARAHFHLQVIPLPGVFYSKPLFTSIVIST